MINSLLERKIEKRPDRVRLQGRILFLTEDPDLIKRQLAGEDLPWDTGNPANNPKLRDDISTDEITPAHYCFYFDETLGEIPYLGLKCGNVTPIGRGDVSAEVVPGTVQFKLNGQELQLTALGGDPKVGFSFVFSDLTAKTAATYPGGRFLDTGPVEDGKVVLDFNRAYNPPCAVTPYATCPLAPKENRLAVAITAGEKFDKAAHDKAMQGHH